MDFSSAVRSRRMVRSFSDSPVDSEVVDSLLEIATRAPSAGNTDGRAFVVLQGPEETSRYWDAVTTLDWRKSSRRFEGMARAPVVIVVLASPDRYVARYGEPDKSSSGLGSEIGEAAWPVPYWFFDAGAAVMALLLAATEQSLGACFLGNFRGEDLLLRVLGVPSGWRLVGAVLLGEPEGPDPVSTSVLRGRPPLSEVVHRGVWTGPPASP